MSGGEKVAPQHTDKKSLRQPPSLQRVSSNDARRALRGGSSDHRQQLHLLLSDGRRTGGGRSELWRGRFIGARTWTKTSQGSSTPPPSGGSTAVDHHHHHLLSVSVVHYPPMCRFPFPLGREQGRRMRPCPKDERGLIDMLAILGRGEEKTRGNSRANINCFFLLERLPCMPVCPPSACAHTPTHTHSHIHSPSPYSLSPLMKCRRPLARPRTDDHAKSPPNRPLSLPTNLPPLPVIAHRTPRRFLLFPSSSLPCPSYVLRVGRSVCACRDRSIHRNIYIYIFFRT